MPLPLLLTPPAFRQTEPPPAWLPGRVRTLVPAETARLQAELYGGPGGWLVRVLQLPEDGDVPTWTERWFTLEDPVGKARPVSLQEVQADPDRARYRGASLPLAGRWVIPAH